MTIRYTGQKFKIPGIFIIPPNEQKQSGTHNAQKQKSAPIGNAVNPVCVAAVVRIINQLKKQAAQEEKAGCAQQIPGDFSDQLSGNLFLLFMRRSPCQWL